MKYIMITKEETINIIKLNILVKLTLLYLVKNVLIKNRNSRMGIKDIFLILTMIIRIWLKKFNVFKEEGLELMLEQEIGFQGNKNMINKWLLQKG